MAGTWRSPHARALHRLGRTDEALAVAEENLAIARRYGGPSAVSRAARELGELRGEAGLPLLEEAAAVLEGTPARLEQAKAAAALGARVRSRRASAASPRSRPRGSSNRDIAQTLFVTPKTVEVHLSNVYRKLGIRSRRELGAALAPG